MKKKKRSKKMKNEKEKKRAIVQKIRKGNLSGKKTGR